MLRVKIIGLVVLLGCFGTLTLARSARAQDLGTAIARAERKLARLQAHRSRLEQRLAEQTRRVQRLKAQPKGVRRDYQLQNALRTSQQLASRLTALRTTLRRVERSVLLAYDRALKVYSDPRRLTRLESRRKALLARRTRVTPPTIVVKGRASPTDSAEDLEETADLLEDSADKVELELARVHRRIAALEARSQLQRHRRSAGGSLFVEESPRRLGRVMGTPSTTRNSDGAAADKSNGAGVTTTSGETAGASSVLNSVPTRTTSSDPVASDSPPAAGQFEAPAEGGASPMVSAPAADNQASAPSFDVPTAVPSASASAQSSTSLAPNLRATLDPATFSQLQRALQRGDARGRLSGYKAAARKLEALADRLSKQARALRRQARAMRKPKHAPKSAPAND